MTYKAYWQDDMTTLYLGDCREKGTCLRSIYFGAAKRVLQKYTKRK